jgi:hypothetical protein
MYDFSKQFNTDMPNLNSSKFVRFNKNMPPQPHPITDNKYTSLNSYFSFSKALNSMWTNANSILKWTLYIYFIYCFTATLIALIILIILLLARNKMAHQFWYNKPVFHKTILSLYYLLPILYYPHVINTTKPKYDKWTNYTNIKFIPILDLDKSMTGNMIGFLRNNYKNSTHETYNYCPETKHFLSYLESHNYPSYLAYYTTTKLENTENIGGLITAYPLNIDIYRTNRTLVKIHQDKQYKNVIYHIDNLCVDLSERKKQLAPELITTLIHRVRNTNSTSMIALFKRENTTNTTEFIVPFVKYPIYVYNITHWFNKIPTLHPAYKMLEVSPQNIHLLYSFLFNNKSKFFDAVIYPDMTNIICLLKNDCFYIYLLMKSDKICGAYFFKNGTTLYKNGQTVECIGSINVSDRDKVFAKGFNVALHTLVKQYSFENLHFEDIAHNYKITKWLLRLNTPFIMNQTSWYFYNYKMNTVNANRVLILN